MGIPVGAKYFSPGFAKYFSPGRFGKYYRANDFRANDFRE
jgi:hypothetical protein